MIPLLLLAQLAIATPPRASFVASCTPGTLVAKFDASASTRGSGGPIVRYKWNWRGGRSESHAYPTASNSWGVAGKIAVKLIVVDSAGQSSPATQRSVTLPCAMPVKPDTVFIPSTPVHDTTIVQLPPIHDTTVVQLPAIHDTTIVQLPPIKLPPDTVKLPCTCDTTKPPPITPPPPPPDTTTPTPTPSPAGETWAELPRVYLNTAMPATPGKILSVPVGGNLQAALNAAQGGDVIELANGGTWTCNCTLPNKSGTSWIVIRPASMTGLPAEGTRMAPGYPLPKIVSPNNQGALMTDFGAHHWRLVALEVTVAPTIQNTGLIRLGTGYETTAAQLPHDLIVDRLYIHGSPTGHLRRAVTLNGGSSAVIDSYISEVHDNGADSQAIWGASGPGPYKITNNYLEAASENVMFGGADPAIPGLIPSDIEIRHNHITKQVRWLGQGWVVKNLFEIKNAQRVLLEGNIFENNWADGQGGSAIVLKSVNQSGGCPWCVAKDITFRYNLIKNTGSGFALTGHDRGAQSIMTRVTITDNLVTGIDQAPFNGDGRGFLINNDPIDLTIAHNTVVQPTNMAVSFGGPTTEPPTRLIIRDDIVGSGQYGVKGQGMGTAAVLAAFMPTGGFVGNVVFGASPVGFPPGNFFPTLTAVGFTSATDFRLAPTSKHKNKASDGKDPGADVDAVLAATARVVIP